MKKLVLFLILAFCVPTICTSITRATAYTLPTNKIGILNVNIDVPTKQDIEETITITTSIKVRSRC